MCLSAEVSVIAGAGITAVGIDALRHARRPAQVPLAGLPVLFGVHQIIEAVAWVEVEGGTGTFVRPAVWAYLVIALVVVPVVAPAAVVLLEPAERQRRMAAFVALGATVAAVLGWALARGPVHATGEDLHIRYVVEVPGGGMLVALYVVATCGAALLSSHRPVRWFGAVNLVAVVLIAWVESTAVISVWCFWAAVASIGIAGYLRRSPLVEDPPVSVDA